ncbi:MAG: lytic transglycosylase domain-containing protein, partial [Candidatus Bipolaricaulaceae bacterium]
ALRAKYADLGREWAYIALGISLSKASAGEALSVGEWYAKVGDWPRAYAVGVRLLSALPSLRAYRLAYPLAWEESVQRWSSAYGVDPFLVWAVMREESGFLPTAVSRSGARGLMQLLPSTARWIAEEKLRIPYGEELLFDPDYNIRLGTWYLRYLLDQFAGNMAWAVAAYNGGPGNLRRWTASLRDPLDFPAALRSPETREYLAKVLNAWLIYRWLYR